MLYRSILSLSALLCLAAAVPLQQHQHQHQHHHHQKREIVWTTTVVEEFVTVTVATTTVHLPPGQSPPAPAAQGPAGQPPAGHGHENHHRPQITSHIKSTVTVHRVPPASQNTPAPQSSPTTPAAAPPPQETTVQSAPSPNTVAPASPSSGNHNKPKKPSSGGGGGGSSSSSSAPSGETHTGDITYYTPGLGSCGITNSESDMIVALAEDMMLAQNVANPNDNPLCGRSITISHGGKTAVARIEDTCPGCAGASLDLTPSLFEIFAPLATGRVSGVEWWFN